MQRMVNLVGLLRKTFIPPLVVSKCHHVLMNSPHACCLKKSEIQSFDYAVNRFLMKLFKTNSMSSIEGCRTYFNFKLSSSVLVTNKTSFLTDIIVVITIFENDFSSLNSLDHCVRVMKFKHVHCLTLWSFSNETVTGM
jgi:hypothetical protein